MACINSTVNFLGSGGVSYSWKGPSGFLSSTQNPSFVPINNVTFNGNYSLTVLSVQGCSAITTTSLLLYALPSGKLTGKIEGCAPFCSDFKYKPLGLSSIRSTTWITTIQYSVAIDFNYCFLNPGNYTITGIIEDTLGCKSSNNFIVTAHPTPAGDFEYLPLKPTENIDNVVFHKYFHQEIKLIPGIGL